MARSIAARAAHKPGFCPTKLRFCAKSARKKFRAYARKLIRFLGGAQLRQKRRKFPLCKKKREIRSAQSAQENMHRREAFAPASCASPPPQTRANRFFTTTLLLTTHAAASLRRFVLYLHKKSIFVLQVATNDLRVMLIRVAVAVCR